MTPILPHYPPQTPTLLHVIYTLAGNIGTVVPYRTFLMISPSYLNRRRIHDDVKKARKWLRANGLQVQNVSGFGYRCVKC